METRRFIFASLVRDYMPDFLEKRGVRILNQKTLDEAEYLQLLKEKLIEEAREVLHAKTNDDLADEFADLIEIMLALCIAYNLPFDQIEKRRLKKAADRGGFFERIYIDDIEVDANNSLVPYYEERESRQKYNTSISKTESSL